MLLVLLKQLSMKKNRPTYEEVMRVRMSFHENGIKGITNRQLTLGAQYGGDGYANGLTVERATKIRRLLRTYNAQ